MKNAYLISIFILAIGLIYVFQFLSQENFYIYYYNEVEDRKLNGGEITCDTRAVLPVKQSSRTIQTPESVIQKLISNELGTDAKIAGFSTEFPNTEFKLLTTKLNEDALELTFTEVPGFTSGGSCRIGLIRAQIEKTALQFEEVKKVFILPEEILQP